MEKKLFTFKEEYKPIRTIIGNFTDAEIDNLLKLIFEKFHLTALDLALEELTKYLLKENNLPEIDVVNFVRSVLFKHLKDKEFIQKYKQVVLDNHKKFFIKGQRKVYLNADLERLIKEKKTTKLNRTLATQRVYRELRKNIEPPKERKKYTRKVPLVPKPPKERIKILKFKPPTPRVRKIEPEKVEKIKKFVAKVRKKKVVVKPQRIIQDNKQNFENKIRKIAKHQNIVEQIKTEMAYNKANGIKMNILNDLKENYTGAYADLRMARVIIDEITIEEIEESINKFKSQYIVYNINNLIYKCCNDFFAKYDIKLCNQTIRRDFKEIIVNLLSNNGLLEDIEAEIEDNKLDKIGQKDYISIEEYNKIKADRFERGKSYYEKIKVLFENVNGEWLFNN